MATGRTVLQVLTTSQNDKARLIRTDLSLSVLPRLRLSLPRKNISLSELCIGMAKSKASSVSFETVIAFIAPGFIAFKAAAYIKEDADYGSDQTQHTGNGRRGDGDGRSGARVGSADWERRSCRLLLRKRPGSHPLRGVRFRLSL